MTDWSGLAEKKLSDAEIKLGADLLNVMVQAAPADGDDTPIMDDIIAGMVEARENFNYNVDKMLEKLRPAS